MRSIFLIITTTLFFCVSAFALPTFNPQLILKNQQGETSVNSIRPGSIFSSWIFNTEAISAAGALSTTIAESLITNASGSTFAVTLAAPTASQDGQVKVIKAVTTMTHTITLAMTNISMSGGYTPTGTTTLTFTSVGQSAIFMAIGSKWVYVGGSAVAS